MIDFPDEVNSAYADQSDIDNVELKALAVHGLGTGVVSGCAVTQRAAGANMSVDIAAGVVVVATVQGTVSAGNVVIGAAHATLRRYDLVVANSSGVKSIIAGTAATLPVFPTVDFTTYALLAAVRVAATVTSIVTGDIVAKDVPLNPDHGHPKLHHAAHSTGGTDAIAAADVGAETAGAVSMHAAAVDPHTGYVQESLVDAAGDLIVGTADNTVGRLAKGAALQHLRVNAGATALEYADPVAAPTTLLGTDTLWAAKGDIVVATADNTAAVLAAPTQRKQVLGADAAGNVAWQPMQAGPLGVRLSDDFLYNQNFTLATAAASVVGQLSVAFVGTASTFNVLGGAANHPGIMQMGTGTTTTGKVSIGSASLILLGGGRARYGAWVRVPVLSVVGQRFEICVGFADTFSTNTIVDGCYFTYVDTVNSGAWSVSTIANSVSTSTNLITTGTTVVAATWYLLEAEVNAAGSSVTYYINGVSTGVTHTTNIPTGTGRETNFNVSILKSLGATTSLFDIDAYYLELDFTTAR